MFFVFLSLNLLFDCWLFVVVGTQEEDRKAREELEKKKRQWEEDRKKREQEEEERIRKEVEAEILLELLEKRKVHTPIRSHYQTITHSLCVIMFLFSFVLFSSLTLFFFI